MKKSQNPKRVFDSPDSQEREYTRLLLGYSKSLHADVNRVLMPRIGAIKSEFEVDARTDGWVDTISALIAELGALALLSAGIVVNKTPNLFEAISKFNNGQFKLVVKANTGYDVPPVMPGAPKAVNLGVNVFRSEPFLKPLAEGWVSENTALIKTLPTRMHPELEGIIRRGVMSGASVKSIKDEIKSRYAITDHRAKLIAQDQTLKLNANLTRYRLESVGVKEYAWETVGDSRVRPDHAELSGRVFAWNKPHPTEGHPSSRPRCRCRAAGIFTDL